MWWYIKTVVKHFFLFFSLNTLNLHYHNLLRYLYTFYLLPLLQSAYLNLGILPFSIASCNLSGICSENFCPIFSNSSPKIMKNAFYFTVTFVFLRDSSSESVSQGESVAWYCRNHHWVIWILATTIGLNAVMQSYNLWKYRPW